MITIGLGHLAGPLAALLQALAAHGEHFLRHAAPRGWVTRCTHRVRVERAGRGAFKVVLRMTCTTSSPPQTGGVQHW